MVQQKWLPVPGQEVTQGSTSGSLKRVGWFLSVFDDIIGNSKVESLWLILCQSMLILSWKDQNQSTCGVMITDCRLEKGWKFCWIWSCCWIDKKLTMGMAVSTHYGLIRQFLELVWQNVLVNVFDIGCPGLWQVHRVGSAKRNIIYPMLHEGLEKISWSFPWGSFPCKVTLSGYDTRLDLQVSTSGRGLYRATPTWGTRKPSSWILRPIGHRNTLPSRFLLFFS